MGDIDEVILSKEEKTFQFENDLPGLPVPDLQNTLKKYLDSVRPHVTKEELQQTELLCQTFENGEGKFLHQKLLEKAQTTRNWLEKWWEQCGYHEMRISTCLMNMAGPGPYVFDIWKPEIGTQIPRAAMMLYFTIQFWQYIRREQIRPQRDSKGRPLCMHQFQRLFSTCKIPGVKQDHLVNYFKIDTEGPAPCNVVVICKGHVFSFSCVDTEERILTVPELQAQLQIIYDRASSFPQALGVSCFTSMERTPWAQVRNQLVALHPDNFYGLEKIEKAILVVGLDDDCPTDIDDLSWKAIFGDASNKWFDKSLNFVCYKNGMFISNCDHSPLDGMMLVFCTHYVHQKILQCHGLWKGDQRIRKLVEPEYLHFHLDTNLMKKLDIVKQFFITLSSQIEVKISHFTDYAKKYLKPCKVHPDTHVQLALQLAYYRMYRKFAPTYETASTRRFYHARTETVRSCTVEACSWCQAMVDSTKSILEKKKLFLSAMAKHNQLMQEATDFHGCDRHLYGLYMIAREEGLPIPLIFQDPAFVKSGGGGNFILSTSCIGYTTVFGGVPPMCPHGYGIFYCIGENKITFFITAWTADEDTSAKDFSEEVNKSLQDMKQLLKQERSLPAPHL